MNIQDYFMKGDMKGAIAFMRGQEAYRDVLPMYVSLFENAEYRQYGLPEQPERILLAYQVYYRDLFYCGIPEPESAKKLLSQLRALLGAPDADEDQLREKLAALFRESGYHAVFGRTQGIYGPYIWKETLPVTYSVELPDGTAAYTVNILKGFVFRSWMDYLTFGRFGTRGWASPDGTINCIEQANDLNSEAFLISLLKHEAQHTRDMKQYPGILPCELEYRAKLVELIYSGDVSLLPKFLSEADPGKETDSHALAACMISRDFAGVPQSDLQAIQNQARMLLNTHSAEMRRKYPADDAAEK